MTRRDKGKEREYSNDARRSRAMERKHQSDMRHTLIDVTQFELDELAKQPLTDANLAKSLELQATLERLHRDRPIKHRKRRKTEIQLAMEAQADIERIERREIRKEQRKQREAKRKREYARLHRAEQRREKRRESLPEDMRCPRCNSLRSNSRQYVVNDVLGIVCKSCWSKIQTTCKEYGIDVTHFCIVCKSELQTYHDCCGDVTQCNCVDCLCKRYLNSFPN